MVGYVFRDEKGGGIPMYRLWNPELNDHLYTCEKLEKEVALAERGYRDEGVVGYVYPGNLD